MRRKDDKGLEILKNGERVPGGGHLVMTGSCDEEKGARPLTFGLGVAVVL